MRRNGWITDWSSECDTAECHKYGTVLELHSENWTEVARKD